VVNSIVLADSVAVVCRERVVRARELVLRCCVRKEERVERESEMRMSEAVSLEILKWDVHWEISCSIRSVFTRDVYCSVGWKRRTAAGSSSRSILIDYLWSRRFPVLFG
jgi:hypothetical protein